jgi:hypothetical protein
LWIRRIGQSRRLAELATFDITAHGLSIYHTGASRRRHPITTSEPDRPPHTQRRTLGRDVADRGDRSALLRPILIDSRCLAAISRYTALRPTLSMSIASAAVAMSGSMIMFLSCLVRFLRSRGSGFPFRPPSRSKVLPWCTFCASRRCRVLLGGGRWSHRRGPFGAGFCGRVI